MTPARPYGTSPGALRARRASLEDRPAGLCVLKPASCITAESLRPWRRQPAALRQMLHCAGVGEMRAARTAGRHPTMAWNATEPSPAVPPRRARRVAPCRLCP
jgi:hypothetical protein